MTLFIDNFYILIINLKGVASCSTTYQVLDSV